MAINEIVSKAVSWAKSTGGIETLGSLIFAKNRSIMCIFPDVTIEEQHTDELMITDHPVERGSPISDHAYMKPVELQMEIGWSESAGKLNSLLGDGFIGKLIGGTPSLVLVYEGLRLLQRRAEPLLVSTGKRFYTNMLIQSISVTTDKESENSLMVKIKLRQIIVTKTQETNLLRIEDQATPEVTASVQDAGTVQPQPVTNESTLNKIGEPIAATLKEFLRF